MTLNASIPSLRSYSTGFSYFKGTVALWRKNLKIGHIKRCFGPEATNLFLPTHLINVINVGSTKTWNPETESRERKQKGKRNTESNINDRKLKNFTLHN